MAKAKVSVSVEQVKFNFAYTCKRCKRLVRLSGDTMEAFRESRRLVGMELCFDCDGKTIEGKKRK